MATNDIREKLDFWDWFWVVGFCFFLFIFFTYRFYYYYYTHHGMIKPTPKTARNQHYLLNWDGMEDSIWASTRFLRIR